MPEILTFVFTDIRRSVDLKGHMRGRSDAERDADFVATVLTPHREAIEQGLADAGGRVVSTAGDGHFLVFANPISAATWAIDVLRRHAESPILTPRDAVVEVRMSLHVGFPQVDPHDENNFIGRVVDYAARLNDHASGGQLLVSSAALGLLKDAGLEGARFHAHGLHELRGIGAVEVHEVLYDDQGPRTLRSEERREAPTAPARPPVREWTVLPATMGLTEFARQQAEGSSSGAALKPPPIRRLGNYELEGLLGAGGMGNVYKARHTQFSRPRAVKIIKPHFVEAGHEEVIRRFYREIKAIGALDHPNIVVAIDSSAPDDQTHFLVMEYVDGVSAEQLISRRQKLSAADACEVARQAAVGLDYIHRQGMVHRDIKPSNLMLTDAHASTLPSIRSGGDPAARRPVVKILDLGLALLATEDQPRLTRFDHGAMGTAMYMSPEQWLTTSVDIRADIYSLGCTLYHLLTGNPPYHDSDLKPQRAHEQAATPSVATDAGAPAELDAVVRRMMAKRPEERFARPADVADALAPFCERADLLTLVDQSRGAKTATERNVGETVPAGRPVGDTLGPMPPPAQASLATAPAPARPWWWRAITPAAIAAAVLFAWWAGTAANQRLRAIQDDRLEIAAESAADALAKEIDDRFVELSRLARTEKLVGMLTTLDGQAEARPEGEPPRPTKAERDAWRPLQEWIATQKMEADTRFESSSWFITDRFGRQLARQNPSEKTLGQWFAWRPYFHGGPSNLPEDTEARPITEPHQSTVYRSKTTQKLKVAFSVPVRNEEGVVIGVLAMSVNLGDFQALENVKRLPEELEAVLVDLRDGRHGRGLLLHHRDLDRLENPEDPFVLPAALLTQVDAALDDAGRDGSPHNPIIRGYADLLDRTGRGAYTGAFEPVIVRKQDEVRNTTWLVIVQEAVSP